MIDYNVYPDMKISCEVINSNEELQLLKEQGKLKRMTWYATKQEIEEYRIAQSKVIVSGDEERFENPTDVDVWLKRKGHEWFCLPAHRTIDFSKIENNR